MFPHASTPSVSEEEDMNDSDDFAIIDTPSSSSTTIISKIEINAGSDISPSHKLQLIDDEFMHLSLPNMNDNNNHNDEFDLIDILQSNNKGEEGDDINNNDDDESWINNDTPKNETISSQIKIEKIEDKTIESDNKINTNKDDKANNQNNENIEKMEELRLTPTPSPSPTNAELGRMTDIINLTEPLIESSPPKSISNSYSPKSSPSSSSSSTHLSPPRKVKNRQREYERFISDIEEDRNNGGCNSYLCYKPSECQRCSLAFFHKINILNTLFLRYFDKCFGDDMQQFS
eukprot:51227_1